MSLIHVHILFIFQTLFVHGTWYQGYDALYKERRLQRALLEVRQKYGSNALLRGFNYMNGGTARERNLQIGGHKA